MRRWRVKRSPSSALLYSVRPLPGAAPLLIAAATVVGLDAFVYLTNGHSVALVPWATAGALMVMLPAGLAGFLERHRVHEHAIVVGLSWPPRSTRYVIPLASIDPASFTVHRRANMIARRLGTGGSPTMRMAVYSTRAVSFTGRSWDAAMTFSSAAAAARRGTRLSLLRLRLSAFGRGPLPTGSTSLWALGVRRPDRLLEAIERALAADGRPQPGLAERALRHPVIEPSGRPVDPGP